MTVFAKKIVTKNSLFIFIFHICANFQTQKRKKNRKKEKTLVER
jgi:hypothetical protein